MTKLFDHKLLDEHLINNMMNKAFEMYRTTVINKELNFIGKFKITSSRSMMYSYFEDEQHRSIRTFDRKLNCKIRPDAKFNWKTFYFSIICALILYLKTVSCLLNNSPQNTSALHSITYRTDSSQFNHELNTLNSFDHQLNHHQTIEAPYLSNSSHLDQMSSTELKQTVTSSYSLDDEQHSSAYQIPSPLFNQNSSFELSYSRNSSLLSSSLANLFSNENLQSQSNGSNDDQIFLPSFGISTINSNSNYQAENHSFNQPDDQMLNKDRNFDTISVRKLEINSPIKPMNLNRIMMNDSDKNTMKKLNNNSNFTNSPDHQTLDRLDSENKIKHLDEPKIQFNQDDLKIYMARTQDKMQKWNDYQTNFTTLKKQILNSTNSSFPVSRHAKSTRQRNLPWPETQNLLAYSGVDEIDLLPESDRGRFMDLASFCDKCFCGALKSRSLKCSKNNQIEFIPILPYEKRISITEILIENQDRFYELNEEQLKYYPNITKLTIQNCGLREVREKTFNSTIGLKEINLRRNKLKALQRKLFDDLQFTELSINENPFTCNCSVKWIQLWLKNTYYHDKLGVAGINITCIDYSNLTKPIKEALLKGCELPVLTVDQTYIRIREGENFTIRCNATADPVPSITWNTFDFKSRYNIKTIFNPNNMPPNTTNTSNSNSNVSKKEKKIIGKIIEVFNASPYDNGPFYCTGENIVGRVNALTNVTILASPKIESLKPVKMFFWCVQYKVTGSPSPKRTWYFNGKPLIFNSTIYDQPFPNTYSKRSDFVITGCLQINSESNVALSGNYTLKIENEFGQMNRTAEVRIMDTSVEVKNANEVPTKLTQMDNFQGISFYKVVLSCMVVILLIAFVTYVFYQGCNYYSKRVTPEDNKIVPQEKIPLNLSHSMVENPNYLQEKHHQMLYNFKDRHIDSRRIVKGKVLGEGAFGLVYLGLVKDLEMNGIRRDQTLVAVKVLKSMPEQLTNEFEREANTLLELNHENIVTFYGVSVDQHAFMMIFEYMKLGDLISFLRSFEGYYSEPNGVLLRNSTSQSFHQQFKSLSNHLNNNNSNHNSNNNSANNSNHLNHIHNNNNSNSGDIDESKESADGSILMTTLTHTYQTMEQEEDANESDALIKQIRKISVKEKRSPVNKEIKKPENHLLTTNEPLIEQHTTLTISDLYSICVQICNGMKYLASEHFVHRDLSCRNCLVTKENGKLIIKIGDFGMSRDIYSNDYYKIGKKTFLPIRWMPPESIMFHKFTLQSDIWSYGVLLWEVWTLGKQPFFELSNLEVISQIENGKRLPQPNHCPDAVYELMERCWKFNPKERPSMGELHIMLNQLHQQHLERKCDESVL